MASWSFDRYLGQIFRLRELRDVRGPGSVQEISPILLLTFAEQLESGSNRSLRQTSSFLFTTWSTR